MEKKYLGHDLIVLNGSYEPRCCGATQRSLVEDSGCTGQLPCVNVLDCLLIKLFVAGKMPACLLLS